MNLPDFTMTAADGQFAASPSPAATLHVRWLGLLDRCLADLKRLTSLNEERFLQVGTRLRDISAGLKTITDNAAEAGRIMTGDDAALVISELELLLREMEGYFLAANRTAEQAGRSLDGIIQELGQMHRLMIGFRDQVGNLRMLKMLTNIQSATLSGRGGGFSNVATDIGNLSHTVQNRSATIIAKIKALQGDLQRAVGMLTVVAERQKHLGGMVVSSMRKDIAALAAMHANCSGGAGNVAHESGDIFREVNNLVVSLQFQDITRQQIEHAREALSLVRRRLAAEGQDALTAEMVNSCALQAAQLTNSAKELTVAVENVTGSLRSIATRSGSFAASIHKLFLLADEVGASSIGDLEQGLTAIFAAVGENFDTNRKLNATMLTVTEAMAEITTFAADIDYIGSEIKLIALNAIIKAAQAGRDGAAFSVIAETVKSQSVEVCEQAAAVVAIIDAISEHVAALQLTIGEAGDVSGADGLQQQRLAEKVTALKEFSGGVGLLLAQTDQASATLMICIERTLLSLENRDAGTILQREVVSELEGLVYSMRIVAPGCDLSVSLADLDAHGSRYTMGSERQIHQQFADDLRNRGAGIPAATAGVGVDFGDNVELF